MMRIRIILALTVLGSTQGTWAQDQSSSYQSDHREALRHYEQAESNLYRGELRDAEDHYRATTMLAPANSQLKRDAEDAIAYRLPLVRAQRLAFTGHMAGAERTLTELLDTFREDPQRRHELEAMLAGLKANIRPITPSGTVDGRTVLREVAAVLEEFRRERGRFPANYRELNSILPVGQRPLESFEIIEYTGRGDGYRMRLRNTSQRDNILTLEKTGLMR